CLVVASPPSQVSSSDNSEFSTLTVQLSVPFRLMSSRSLSRVSKLRQGKPFPTMPSMSSMKN
ncbi:hypothetical protein MYU51_019319, partial [Penicillium brevicompactum]